MSETTQSVGTSPLTGRQRKRAIASWEAARKREVEASLSLLRARQAAERVEKIRTAMAELWPVWLGIFVGVLGPAIQDIAASVASWCATLIFPFVKLAERPEIQAGPITHLLPTLMLYGQFPIEGFLAYIVLKRRVRPLSVIWQVFLFHFLGLMELWMLSGGAAVLVGR